MADPFAGLRDRLPSPWGHAFAWGVAEALLKPWMRLRIRRTLVAGLPDDLPPDAPLLLCPDHGSWWDGFLVRELQRILRPDAPCHPVMLASELRRRPLLELLGAVGLRSGSVVGVRSVLRGLRRARRRRSDLVVAYFPQGRITAPHARPVDFRPGVRLVREALGSPWTLPVSLHLAFPDGPRATAFVSVGEPVPPGPLHQPVEELLEARVAAESAAVLHHLASHGAEAAEGWPDPGSPLPRAPGTFRTASGSGWALQALPSAGSDIAPVSGREFRSWFSLN